jgi:DNA (cytosine-5)-methyltransferase 1
MAVGFKTVGYEKLEDASETYRKNLNGECFAKELTPETDYPKADIVIGGPP